MDTRLDLAPLQRAAPAAAGPMGGRDVLVLDVDLFRHVGGGQSVYGRIIQGRPQDRFHYFREREAAEAPRPPNTVAIPLVRPRRGNGAMLQARQALFLDDYVAARNFAASAAAALPGRAFDVVDVPDYRPIGAFVRPAFLAEGVRIGQVALALHGTLSDAFRGGWPAPADSGARRAMAALRLREHLQFRAADQRYAISEDYSEQWRRTAPLPVRMLDPLCVAGGGAPAMSAPAGTPPDLAFIGRREKWKGPDLFLDIAWCLHPGDYGRLILAGPDGPNRLGQGSEATLALIARNRGLAPELPGPLGRAAVEALFAGRTLLLLPSRHDTFNLTALEAVRAGCPVVVSDRAGVARWLRARFPGLGWLTAEVDCGRAAAGTVARVLRDYDRHREALLEALHRAPLRPDAESLAGLYTEDRADPRAAQMAADLAAVLAPAVISEDARGTLRPLREALRGTAPAGLRGSPAHRAWKRLPHGVRAGAHAARETGRDLARILRHGGAGPVVRGVLLDTLRNRVRMEPRLLSQVAGLRRLDALHRYIREAPERTDRELRAKLGHLSAVVPSHLVDRVTLFQAMARLERRRGNDLVAATYLLRVMRWLGEDRRGALPFVAATLSAHGFAREAAVAEAMFGPAAAADPRLREERCLDLLRGAADALRANPERPLAVLDDRRPAGHRPRVSVVASLYSAADKMPVFLSMLAEQSLAARGEMEIVLVDSASPSDERGAFEAFAAAHPRIPIAYARSAARETIQTAWNRGILLARAPYLALLGADEGVHPDALRRLAEALDADPGADWVVSDSLVTAVDRNGVFDADTMVYDRTGFRQDLTWLETCYLTYVGGLYRRSVHDRAGWYDESYRGAGDTEFKNRVMPRIRSIHLPETLGVFNNYPEERTTQHPRAEIEDLRAWYLWRTPAGMRLAFGHRPAEEAAVLLRETLGGYRKSFCGHFSSDLDLAEALAAHLSARPDAPAWTSAAPQAVARALDAMRAIEEAPMDAAGRHPAALGWWGWQGIRRLRAEAEALREGLGLHARPGLDAFMDNRHEQHWWSWSGG